MFSVTGFLRSDGTMKRANATRFSVRADQAYGTSVRCPSSPWYQ